MSTHDEFSCDNNKAIDIYKEFSVWATHDKQSIMYLLGGFVYCVNKVSLQKSEQSLMYIHGRVFEE